MNFSSSSLNFLTFSVPCKDIAASHRLVLSLHLSLKLLQKEKSQFPSYLSSVEAENALNEQ